MTVVVGLTGVDSVVVVAGSVVVVLTGAAVDVVVARVVETVSWPAHAVMTRTRNVTARSRIREDDRGCLFKAIGKFPT
ncbi:MAG: hypothetical protein ACXW1Y_12415, partial [Acidimicrobiia bacterium]